MLPHKLLTSFFILCVTASIIAQSITGGSSMSGFKNNTGFEFEKSLGVVEVWTANYGVKLSGTNVSSWAGHINGFLLDQAVTTNQPSFYSTISTNNFPALYFDAENGPNKLLRCDGLAAQFSGTDKPMSMWVVVSWQTNAVNTMATGFGWTSASNNNASIISLRPANATPTTHSFIHSSNTNQQFAAFSKTGGFPTNCYGVVFVSYSGTSGRTQSNLASGAETAVDQGLVTLDTFAVGMIVRTNGGYAFPARGYITEVGIATNEIIGVNNTNLINRIGSTATGRFPCF